MSVLQTERLKLRELSLADADFMLDLLNQPSFIRNIGDRGVRSLADAKRYLEEGPIASYARFGFGLWLLELREANAPIGICGLLKRDSLPDVDIGFALLPEFWSRGYAREAAAAVRDYAHEALALERLIAITAPHNAGSIRVLRSIGLEFERMIRLSQQEPEIALYSLEL